jgi:hypothetical protein
MELAEEGTHSPLQRRRHSRKTAGMQFGRRPEIGACERFACFAACLLPAHSRQDIMYHAACRASAGLPRHRLLNPSTLLHGCRLHRPGRTVTLYAAPHRQSAEQLPLCILDTWTGWVTEDQVALIQQTSLYVIHLQKDDAWEPSGSFWMNAGRVRAQPCYTLAAPGQVIIDQT